MTILLLGASGRTGKWLLLHALLKGHHVRALVRNRGLVKASSPLLTIFEGQPTDPAALSEAARGCDVCISALNISRRSDFPWSALRTPPQLLSDTMRQLVRVAQTHPLQRILIVSAWGVAETKKNLPAWFRWLIHNSNIGAAYRDHERQEQVLVQSGIRWTSIRPTGLVNSRKEKPVTVSIDNQPRPSLTISRNNLARFIIEELGQQSYINKALVVSS